MSDSVIEELRMRYRASSGDKKALLLALSDAYQGGQREQSQRHAELQGALHKLAGSSGMYGYTELHSAASKALRILEGDSINAADVTDAVVEVVQALEKL